MEEISAVADQIRCTALSQTAEAALVIRLIGQPSTVLWELSPFAASCVHLISISFFFCFSLSETPSMLGESILIEPVRVNRGCNEDCDYKVAFLTVTQPMYGSPDLWAAQLSRIGPLLSWVCHSDVPHSGYFATSYQLRIDHDRPSCRRPSNELSNSLSPP